MAFYSNIDDIREKFFELNGEQWELYNGKVKNRPKQEVKYRFLLDEWTNGDTDESWNHLENTLNRVSLKGGNAMLFIGPPDETPKLALPLALSTKTMTRQTGSGAIGTQSAGVAGIRGFNDTLSDKLQIYDLQKRLNDLENSQTGSVFERIGERLIDSISPDLLVGAITAILGKITGTPTVIAANTPGVSGDPATDSTGGLDSSIDNLIDVLGENFNSESEMVGFIDKMTATVKNNPAILKNLR